jgi:hypothetical protein
MKSSRTTTVTREAMIGGVLAFILLAVLAFTFLPGIFFWATTPKPAEVAAREGAQAILSIDTDKDREAWESDVCKVSNGPGCAVFKSTFAAMIWSGAERNSLRQSCQTTDANLVKTIKGEEVARQAWSVKLDCRNIQTDEISAGEVLAFVVQVGDGWKFERIAFEEEINNAK